MSSEMPKDKLKPSHPKLSALNEIHVSGRRQSRVGGSHFRLSYSKSLIVADKVQLQPFCGLFFLIICSLIQVISVLPVPYTQFLHKHFGPCITDTGRIQVIFLLIKAVWRRLTRI